MKHVLRFSVLFIALIAGTAAAGQVMVNEYCVTNLASTTDNYGQYEDWIELFNSGSSTYDLAGHYISDDPDEPFKWQFPEGSTIGAQAFIKVWVTGRNEVTGNNYHTNFRLTQTKDTPEHIVLTDQLGNTLEDITIQISQKEHSRGRTTNGSASWSIFTNPTPGSTNSNATSYSQYAAKPVVSDTAGFYSGPVEVSFTNEEPNSELRYTTDGSEPTASSIL